MTIWTALTMTDIEYDAEAGTGIPIPGLNVTTQAIGNGSETRLISTTDTGRMLHYGLVGWLNQKKKKFSFFLIKITISTWGKVISVRIHCVPAI